MVTMTEESTKLPTHNMEATDHIEPSREGDLTTHNDTGKALHNFRSMADLIRNKEVPHPVEADLDSMSPLKEGRSDENENSVQDLRVNGHHPVHMESLSMREEHLRRWYSGDLGMRNQESYNVDVDGESTHSEIPSEMSSERGDRQTNGLNDDDEIVDTFGDENNRDGGVVEADNEDEILDDFNISKNSHSDIDNMSETDMDVRKSKRKQYTPKQRDSLQNSDELPTKVRRVEQNSFQLQLELMQQQIKQMQERFYEQLTDQEKCNGLKPRFGVGHGYNFQQFHPTPLDGQRKSPLGPLGVKVDLSKTFESKSKTDKSALQQTSPVYGDTPKDLANLAKLLKDELSQQVGTLVDTVVTKIAATHKSNKSQVPEVSPNVSSASGNNNNTKEKTVANTNSDVKEKANPVPPIHSSNTTVPPSPHENRPHLNFSPRIPQHHEPQFNHRNNNNFMENMKFPGFPFTSMNKPPKMEGDKLDKLEMPRPHKPKINDKLINPYFDPARGFADFTRHAPWFPPLPFHPYSQVGAPPPIHAAFGAALSMKDQEQTEALPLVVSSPKKKRTKVTDTRLSPRAARALLQEPVPAEQPLQSASMTMERKEQMPMAPVSFHSPLIPVSLPTSVAIPNPSLQHSDVFGMYHHHHHQQQQQNHHQQPQQPKESGFPTREIPMGSSRSPVREDSSPCMSYTPSESPSLFKNDLMDARYGEEASNLDGYPMTSTLTPMHLRKAKLMFFYVRYPSSSILKIFFPDVKFNKNNTAQLVKWFSNFREFYYIQMEKYARQALAEGVKNPEDLIVTTDSELYRVLNLHYNRNNQLEVPENFRVAVQATLREFFKAVAANKDTEQSWKKPIYKVIARMDDTVPEYFKSPNWMEQLNDI